MTLISRNPFTEEITNETRELSDLELEQKIALADLAFSQWKKTSFAERGKLMLKMADYLSANKERFAKIMSQEMGKTITAATAEIEKCALVCEYYSENAEKFLSPELVQTNAPESYVAFEPLGVVLAIMPWNFPFWQVYRFAAPAIMAGNVGVLKHASNVQMSASAIETAFNEVGFPQGVFQNLAIGSARVESVIRNPLVKAVTLTGSEKAGTEVARIAGFEVKKTVLELGGSDPFIVLADADIDLSCEIAVAARMQNNAGQSCVSAKRFIVQKQVISEFVSKFKEHFRSLKVGDPSGLETNVGPLSSEQILKDVERQVEQSVKLGAKIEFGGKRAGQKGYFYQPTILTNVKKGMPAYDEEVFGPVAAVIEVNDEEDAVRVANDTRYGLGASLWTSDITKAKKLIPQIEAGLVFVNMQVRSDPRVPFGGVKKSGYGRELGSYGIKEFVNIKTVLIKL